MNTNWKDLKPVLLVGSFLVLGAVAIADWNRDASPQASFGEPYQELIGYNELGQPVYEQRGVYTTIASPPSIQPGTQPLQPVGAQPLVQPMVQPMVQPVSQRIVTPVQQPQARPAVVQTVRTEPVRVETVEQPQSRSKKASAAIIGGSAGAGAAIGAIAGGGKGAGIGAIAGGVGGLIYDQVTRDKSDRF